MLCDKMRKKEEYNKLETKLMMQVSLISLRSLINGVNLRF